MMRAHESPSHKNTAELALLLHLRADHLVNLRLTSLVLLVAKAAGNLVVRTLYSIVSVKLLPFEQLVA